MSKLGSYSFRDGNAHTKPVGDLRWSFDGSYLASASFDKSVKIGQLDNNGNVRAVQTIQRTGSITQACWHPTDNSLISLVGEEKSVELWDIRANRTVSKIQCLAHNINAAWSPNGHYISVGNKSDNLVVLDARAARQLKKMKFPYEINEMCWSLQSDHILLATGGAEMGGVEIVHFDGAELLQLCPPIAAHTSNCYCLKADPTYSRLAVGSADFLVSMWDMDDMVCTHTIQALDSPVRCLAFSGDGERIAVAAEGSTLLICGVQSGAVETSIDCRSPLMALSWHPRHDIIAIAPDSSSADSSRVGGQDKFVRLISFAGA